MPRELLKSPVIMAGARRKREPVITRNLLLSHGLRGCSRKDSEKQIWLLLRSMIRLFFDLLRAIREIRGSITWCETALELRIARISRRNSENQIWFCVGL